MEGQLLRLLRYREELPAEDLRLWQVERRTFLALVGLVLEQSNEAF